MQVSCGLDFMASLQETVMVYSSSNELGVPIKAVRRRHVSVG